MRNIWRVGAGLVLAGAIVTGAIVTSATAQPSGRLTIYTSQPSSQMAKVVEAFNKVAPEGPDLALSLRHHRGDEPAAGRIRRRPAAGRRGAGRRRGRDHAAQERRPAADLRQGAGREDAGGADRSRQDLLRHQADHHRHRHQHQAGQHAADVVAGSAGAGGRGEDRSWRIRSIPARRSSMSAPSRSRRSSAGRISRSWRAAAPSPPRATAP